MRAWTRRTIAARRSGSAASASRISKFNGSAVFITRSKWMGSAASTAFTAWVGTMPELGIGQAQGAALASLDNFVYPTDVEASDRWFQDDIVSPSSRFGTELSIFRSGPGLGVSIDRAKIQTIPNSIEEFFTNKPMTQTHFSCFLSRHSLLRSQPPSGKSKYKMGASAPACGPTTRRVRSPTFST